MSYPLLPYSQLVFDLQKIYPGIYTTESVVRLNKREVDIPRLKAAIEKAIRNHPVFMMHVDEQGQQEYAPQTDALHGQYHSVDFQEEGENVYITLKGNRILGDGHSDVMIIKDVMRAYCGLALHPDKYLDYLQKMEEHKLTPRYVANRQWLEVAFDNIACPVHPKTDFPLDANEMPDEGTLADDYSTLQEALTGFAQSSLLSHTAFFSLCAALAMMEYNGCDEAALTWAYDGRESEEEQYIYGSLHRDIPFTIQTCSQKDDLIRSTRKQIRDGIAHSSYPYTLTPPHTDIWNYALNVLVQPTQQEKSMDLPFAFEIIDQPSDKPAIAYSLLDVEIYEKNKLIINYRYSATHYKPESIRRFAALVRKYAEWLLN